MLDVHIWATDRHFTHIRFEEIKKEFWLEIGEMLDSYIPKKWKKDGLTDFVIYKSDYHFDISVFVQIKDKKSLAILKTCLPPDMNCSLLEKE